MPILDPEQAIRVPGPWTHRDVPAHGARFHVVEAGEGPAVVLLHGFPTYWWTWRGQVTALAAAGYHAIAMDLRGYGGSDHTPHGYDPISLSADVAGVIRCLGESDAIVIGHGWGGLIAWSMAVTQPDAVRGIVTVSAPHPRVMRRAALRPRQLRKLGYLAGFQLPFLPENSFMKADGARISELLTKWSASPQWVDEAGEMYRAAFLRWPTAHTAIEYHRWSVRSLLRPDGLRYMSAMSAPIDMNVLQIHGAKDPMVLIESCKGSDKYVSANYEFEAMQTGHFPHEESPDNFNSVILPWLAEQHK